MMYKLKKNIASKPKRFKKPLLIALIILGVAGLGVGGLEYTDTTYWFHDRPTTHETQKNTPNRTAGQDTKGEGTSKNSSQSSGDQAGDEGTYSPGSEDKTPAETAPEDNNGTLITPDGNFVNTHKMGYDSAANTQQSVCVTTPGAKCNITFARGSEVHELGAQTTDRGGAAYWTWSPKSAGLSVGTWKVTAKATLGNQVKTKTDLTPLEVN
jgi:hypothetical protein